MAVIVITFDGVFGKINGTVHGGGQVSHAAQKRDPNLCCARAKTDDTLKPKTQRAWQANIRVNALHMRDPANL